MDTNAYTDSEKADLAALRAMHTESDEPSGFVRSNPNIMGIIELSPDGTIIHRIDQNGDYSQNSTGIFYDGSVASARQVRVSPVTGQDLIVYINGVRFVMASQVVTFAAVSGLKYIHYDSAGVLTGGTVFTYDYFDGTPIVAIAYGNATTGELVLLGDERHGITMDGFTHRYLHTTEGARYAAGMNIAGLADGVTVHGELGVGEMYDEDIFNELPAQTNLPFWYIDDNSWRIVPDTNLLGYTNGADTYISFNEDVAGVYQLTEVTGSNEATIMYILATNSAQFPYVKIIGQHKYDKVSDAQNAIGTELAELNTDLLPTPEFVFVGAIIIDRAGELQLLDDGSTFLDLRTIKIPAQGGLSDAIVDHRTVTFRDEPNAHPATSTTYDPTGTFLIATDVQAAIDEMVAAAASGLIPLTGFVTTNGVATGNVNNAVYKTIIFDNIIENIDSVLNITTGELTFLRAGKLSLSSYVTLQNANPWNVGEIIRMQIYVNNVPIAVFSHEFEATVAETYIPAISAGFMGSLIAVNDVVKVGVYQNSGSALSIYNDQLFNRVSWSLL